MSRGATSPARILPGAASVIILVASLGLVLVALGNNASRTGTGSGPALFWVGLCLIYAPIAFRLLGARADRRERLALVAVLGLSLFFVKVLHSPAEFVRFDEFGWWRATKEVLVTGHTFTGTQLNPATAGYPVLPVLTGGIAQLSELSIFHSGLIVIGVARLIFVLAFFLVLERILGSGRAAGIGILVYACNSSFVYFDAQFGYESLALALAVVFILVAQRWSSGLLLPPNPLANALAAVVILIACGLTFAHHLTSLFMVAFLCLWTVSWSVGRWNAQKESAANGPLFPLLVLAVSVACWLLFVAGTSTISELGGLFHGAFSSVADLILGTSHSKRLFSGAGEALSPVERGLIVASTLAALAVLAVGLDSLRRSRSFAPLRLTLVAVALLYPVSLFLRFTQASSAIAGRAPEFVFFGTAFLAGLIAVNVSVEKWGRTTRRVAHVGLAGIALIAFVGGFTLGELKVTRQPGPYRVGAEGRAISPQGVSASRFAGSRLPAGSAVLTDRADASLMGSYGRLDPLFGRFKRRSVARVLTDEDLERGDVKVLRGMRVDFIVVDRRLSREIPAIGTYVDSSEPKAAGRPKPVTRAALMKFEAMPGFSKIYTNGPVTIYTVPWQPSIDVSQRDR